MTKQSKGSAPRPFTGGISAADAIKGAQLLQENAVRLLVDAKLLLSAKRYPSAAMVAVMALDELSRFFHPLTLAKVHAPKQLAEGWRQFRSGRRTFPWSAFQRTGQRGANSMSDAETNEMLSFISSLGRGVDFIEPGLWIDPSILVSRELATSIVGTAEMFCQNMVEPRSMDIWMEAIGSLPRNATLDVTLKTYQKLLESDGLVVEAGMIGSLAARQNIAAGHHADGVDAQGKTAGIGDS